MTFPLVSEMAKAVIVVSPYGIRYTDTYGIGSRVFESRTVAFTLTSTYIVCAKPGTQMTVNSMYRKKWLLIFHLIKLHFSG